jgi:hypothetical protein
MSERKVYLGDQVYYDVQNGMVLLSTHNGVLNTNEIWLEPMVVAKLLSELGKDFDKGKLCIAIGVSVEPDEEP